MVCSNCHKEIHAGLINEELINEYINKSVDTNDMRVRDLFFFLGGIAFAYMTNSGPEEMSFIGHLIKAGLATSYVNLSYTFAHYKDVSFEKTLSYPN